MIRTILATVMGVLLSVVLVMLGEMASNSFGVGAQPADMSDRAALAAYVARQPMWLMALMCVIWGVAVGVGAYVAARFARRGPWPGWIVTILFLVATVANFTMIPHPLWMFGLAIAAIVIGGGFGTRWALGGSLKTA